MNSTFPIKTQGENIVINLGIHSEVRPLGGVIVYKPGDEHNCVTPNNLRLSLLEDLLDPEWAAVEHDEFTACLRRLGVRVLAVDELLVSLLERESIRAEVCRCIINDPNTCNDVCDLGLSPEDLARFLISGYHDKLGQKLIPLCNLAFTRDSAFVVGSCAFIANPKEPVRQRESAIMEMIFGYHKTFEQVRTESARGWSWPIEGGDVVVINNKTVVVGGVHRTHHRAAERLAITLLEMGFENILRISFHENSRRIMHLDTTFMPISDDEALVFPQVMIGQEAELNTSVMLNYNHGDQLFWKSVPTLLDDLKEVGVELTPIPCGGPDPIQQERDQWNDGCNAFAVAPGVIFVYDRCKATLNELSEHGYKVIEASAVQSLPGQKTVIKLPSKELPKARGGWRCMTMPLWRD